MARPIKNGLDYFPMDVVCNDKIELIEAEFGLTGFAIVVKLFQKIYGEHGYYCEWTDEVALLFGKKNGLGGNVVSEIVGASIKRGIFDKDLFEKYGILTSVGVQKRYFEAVNRRKQVEVKEEYLLISYTQFSDNVSKNSVNVDINSENVCNNPQRKVKESKEKKSKVNQSKGEESKKNICTADIYSLTLELFSEICKSLPKPQELTPERKRLIDNGEEKLFEYGKTFEEFFNEVEESDFLSGRNGKWTGCNFDWILKPLNMVKILEGNYTNQGECSPYIFGSRKKGYQNYRGDVSYDLDAYERYSMFDDE
ncbi:MAG: DUF4373 domain-containing protein [Ruminococcus sp.]